MPIESATSNTPIHVLPAIEIIQNLPPFNHSTVDVITNRQPFPTSLKAKNMLNLRESQ